MREGEKGRAFREPGVVFNLIAAAVPDHDQHGKREQRHEEIGDEIVCHRCSGKRDHADEQITGVRDARIGEESFQIRLREGGEISVDESQRGDDNEQAPDLRENEKGRQHAQEDDKPRRLRADGEKRGHRRRRTLVNIRHPDLEWHGGDLETEGDEDERNAKKQRDLVNLLRCQNRAEYAPGLCRRSRQKSR